MTAKKNLGNRKIKCNLFGLTSVLYYEQAPIGKRKDNETNYTT